MDLLPPLRGGPVCLPTAEEAASCNRVPDRSGPRVSASLPRAVRLARAAWGGAALAIELGLGVPHWALFLGPLGVAGVRRGHAARSGR